MKKIARLMVLVMTMGSIFGFAAQPASAAAVCATEGLVFASAGQNQVIVKRETDPVNANPPTIVVDVPNNGGTYTFFSGGNGLKPNTNPWWDVYDSNGYIHRVDGTPTGTTCVSAQKTHTLTGKPGNYFLAKANYDGGNSGKQVRNQNHFWVLFV